MTPGPCRIFDRADFFVVTYFPLYILSIITFSPIAFKEHSDSIQLSSFQEQQLKLNKSQSFFICKQFTRNPMLLSQNYYTSVAIMHSFFSSPITKTDWYTGSLEEHIVDIRHSGLSLYIFLK